MGELCACVLRYVHVCLHCMFLYVHVHGYVCVYVCVFRCVCMCRCLCVCVCVQFMMCPNRLRTNSKADDPYQVYPHFLSPYTNRKVQLIICPSHRVKHVCFATIPVLDFGLSLL